MTTVFIVLGAAAVVIYALYASLITKKNRVLESLGGIDAGLTQRHDLIPNMLEIAKSFMEHERGIMNEITALRNQARGLVGSHDAQDVKALLAAEGALTGKMGQFFAVAENYPNLKSDGPMMEAQQTYRQIEDNLAAARRFYNSAVGDLNNAAEIFPSSVIAGMIGIKPYPFYEAPDAHRETVNAADILRRAS